MAEEPPWLKYVKPTADGPWAKYQGGSGQPSPTESIPRDLGGDTGGETTAKSTRPSWVETLFTSAQHGAGDVVAGGRQLASRIPGVSSLTGETPQMADQAARQRQSAYMGPFAPGPGQPLSPARANPTTARIGDFAGGAAATAPAALISGGASIPAMAARGALAGAAGAAPQPVLEPDYWKGKAMQVGLGAGAGAALGTAGGMMAPARSPEQQMLAARGQRFSPGMAQPGGEIQAAERSLQAFPFVRGLVQGVVGRRLEDFNRVVGRQVLEPIGGVVPNSIKGGHPLNRFVEKQLDTAYERVKPQLSLTRQGAADVMQNTPEVAQLVSELPEDLQRRYAQILQNRVLGRFPQDGSPMDGETFKQVERLLGRRASSYVGTNDQELGEALYQTQKVLRDRLAVENPRVAPELQKINESWAMWVRMRDASNRRATGDGMFTPVDLLHIARRESTDSQFSKGDAVLQVMGEAGERSIGGSLVPRRPAEAIRWGNLIHGAVMGVPWAVMNLAQKAPVVGQTARRLAPAVGAAGARATQPRDIKEERDTTREPRTPAAGP